jgi:hypothetical protein
MINVKLTCNWENNEKITKRLLDQFKSKDIDLSNINFVDDLSYDVMVIFGYITEELKKDSVGYLFPQEPSWSGSHQRGFHNCSNLTVYGFDKSLYSGDAKIIESLAYMFYGGVGPGGEGWDNWTYDNLQKINPYKTNNICSFISTKGFENMNREDGCLYPLRCKLVDSIKHLDFIDFFGGWQFDKNNNKQYAQSKFNNLLPYKFTLTVENSNENFYLSEKFFDPILVNSIPIYFGCKNIKSFFPENGYILLDNITDYHYINEKLNYINNNAEQLYNEMYPELLKIKHRYFTERNILKKITELV